MQKQSRAKEDGPIQWIPNAVKGRGTSWQLPHRFHTDSREAFDDGWSSLDERFETPSFRPPTEVTAELAKSIIAKNDSPDIGFDLSINPYRGCEHGCIYCYARPTHSYLNLSPGLDFETRIVAKTNAAERLREAFAKPGYQPKALNLGSITDAYQPAERQLRLTRSVIEVLAEHQHAFSVITKGALVLRDLDLIAPMAASNRASVDVSVTTLDPQLARILEPRAAAPHRRLEVIRALVEAGIPVRVSVSPLIPFINEMELEKILEAAAAAGASAASCVLLRLPWEVRPLFESWLQQHFPDRAERVLSRLRDMRSGQLNDSQFGSRMTGTGVWADLIRQRFHRACTKAGMARSRKALDLSGFRRPVDSAEPSGAGAGSRRLVPVAPIVPGIALQKDLFDSD